MGANMPFSKRVLLKSTKMSFNKTILLKSIRMPYRIIDMVKASNRYL